MNKIILTTILLATFAFLITACEQEQPTQSEPGETETDAGAEVETETDADTDVETEVETDSDADVILHDGDDGKELTLVEGSKIEIVLSGNPTTGFEWSLDGITGQAVAPLGESTYEPDPQTQHLEGAGGAFHFRFGCVGKGDSTITLQYARPWEDVPPSETFSVSITVE